MAFSKRTWKAREGVGLNKFSIDGAPAVTIKSTPDAVTQNGDTLSASNLNDLEDRIYNAVAGVENAVSSGLAGIKALTNDEIDSACK